MLEEIRPHLAELQKRLVISLSVIFVFFFVGFTFWKYILALMLWPLADSVLPAEILKNLNMWNYDNVQIELAKKGLELIALDPLETLFSAFKLSFFAALILSLPVIFWQIWLFVSPGLYDHEKKNVLPFTFFASAMFLLGAAFCYFFVIPLALGFVVNFGEGIVKMTPRLNSYVSFIVKILFGFGVAFELPVISLFLAKLGLITDKSLKDFFRYAIVLIFIFAALITPPDVISQFLMAIPLIFLYAVSILIVKQVNPYIETKDEDNEKT